MPSAQYGPSSCTASRIHHLLKMLFGVCLEKRKGSSRSISQQMALGSLFEENVVQTLTLHRGQRRDSSAESIVRSEFEFVAPPGSSLSDVAVPPSDYDFGWGSFSSKNSKKRKGEKVRVNLPEEPAAEPEAAWESWGDMRKKGKKTLAEIFHVVEASKRYYILRY